MPDRESVEWELANEGYRGRQERERIALVRRCVEEADQFFARMAVKLEDFSALDNARNDVRSSDMRKLRFQQFMQEAFLDTLNAQTSRGLAEGE